MGAEKLSFLGLKTETKSKDLEVKWKKPVGHHNPGENLDSVKDAYQKNENFILDSTKAIIGLKWPAKQLAYFACGTVQDTLGLAKTGADLFFGSTTIQKKLGEHVVNKYQNNLKYKKEDDFDKEQKDFDKQNKEIIELLAKKQDNQAA